ncbi:DUF4388 domain-containing protein [Deinococcus wulumuqiensis]|uniref:DUF4388 domain-containing protein n=1 Tax=Deinococcus wulumuqiensis TaxID=980427 RepID=A0AAV4K1V9_9DEIO|nr:DUF4388 domain-containing protein [Deinococcus wulumuqiensis]QII19382.1 hypothetical protein G6R31_00375 [Deinococcus wulumuqiensis R12]GGI77135.1 hypothetical protein GCM10010914_09280 [Deinococcus wulumuqiensis]GGP30720.1 hypothetical protein GCM10008021_23710 [Deinococcus wulumuqiensis]
MAIYGDFEYHAFNDIIKVLQRHSGVLFMRTALAGRSVELHLRQGTLQAVFVDGFPVNEPLRVRDTVRQLVSGARGEYSFEAGPTEYQLALPMNELIREALSGSAIPDQQLPHQDTRFEVVASAQSMPLPESLRASWASLSPLLRGGASASDLASQLRVSLPEARAELYRFRAAGLIAPQRAAAQAQASAQPAGPVRRLLSALRRLTGGSAA